MAGAVAVAGAVKGAEAEEVPEETLLPEWGALPLAALLLLAVNVAAAVRDGSAVEVGEVDALGSCVKGAVATGEAETIDVLVGQPLALALPVAERLCRGVAETRGETVPVLEGATLAVNSKVTGAVGLDVLLPTPRCGVREDSGEGLSLSTSDADGAAEAEAQPLSAADLEAEAVAEGEGEKVSSALVSLGCAVGVGGLEAEVNGEAEEIPLAEAQALRSGEGVANSVAVEKGVPERRAVAAEEPDAHDDKEIVAALERDKSALTLEEGVPLELRDTRPLPVRGDDAENEGEGGAERESDRLPASELEALTVGEVMGDRLPPIPAETDGVPLLRRLTVIPREAVPPPLVAVDVIELGAVGSAVRLAAAGGEGVAVELGAIAVGVGDRVRATDEEGNGEADAD